MRSVEEHKKVVRTDEIQQIHTLYNLNELLRAKPRGVLPTLRDDAIPDQVMTSGIMWAIDGC